MAYMTQEMKKALAPGIKAVLKKYNVKATIGVEHHSTLLVNIKESAIDFGGKDNHTVNNYHIEAHYEGVASEFLTELNDAMNGCEEFQNFDKSDIQSDYFHVGWYININIGKWNKPYVQTAA